MNITPDLVWTEDTGAASFTLNATDPNDENITFQIVGTDGGSSANTFQITATKEGDDSGTGSAKRVRSMGMTSTMGASYSVRESLTADMFRRANHWCREQREDFYDRPIAGLNKSPYSSAYGV